MDKVRAVILGVVALSLCGMLSLLCATCGERIREEQGPFTPQEEAARQDSLRERFRQPEGTVPRPQQ